MERKFFAAMTDGLNVRIVEQGERRLRALSWSELTRAERREGQKIVNLLTAPCQSACELNYANRPKDADTAKAVADFIAALECRHGEGVWFPWEKRGA